MSRSSGFPQRERGANPVPNAEHGAAEKIRGSERFLEMKTGQAAADLLCGHRSSNFRPDQPKSALAIKPVSRLLNLSCAQNHLRESARTRLPLRKLQHALRDAQTAIARVEVHSSKLRFVGASVFDTKRADNFIFAFDHPKHASLCLRKDLRKLPQLTIDDGRDVLLE